MYAMFLDASKAFDRVNFTKLFELLLKKGICALECRFLMFLYCNQLCQIRWRDCVSTRFNVSNGVKQGGVLSPFLFGIYIDQLLNALHDSSVGCYIGNTFVGAFAYADDIVILAPAKSALNRMLKIADKFSVAYDIKFNPTKSELLVYEVDPQKGEKQYIVHNSNVIYAVDFVRHLGHIVGLKSQQRAVEGCVYDFNNKVNMLMSYFSCASSHTLNVLFSAYCMALYGICLWDLTFRYTVKDFTPHGGKPFEG